MSLYKYSYKGKYKDIIGDWGDDRECDVIEKEIDEWLDQFDDGPDKELMAILLSKFNLYRGKLFKNKLIKMFDIVDKKYNNWMKNTQFFSINKNENNSTFSRMFFDDFWFTNNIQCFCKNDALKSCEDIKVERLILVDDYAGTGNSIIKYMESLITKNSLILEKELVILLMICTRSAFLQINNFIINKNFECTILYVDLIDKLFNNEIDLFPYKKSDYLNITNKFGLKYALGYGNIESMIGFDKNIPNNSLGAFWETLSNNEKVSYKSLRTRYTNRKTNLSSIITSKKKRNKIKQNISFSDGFLDYLFIGYCVRKKRRFSTSDLCSHFGLTKEQYEIKIQHYLDRGLLEIDKGRYKSSSIYWNEIKKTKYSAFFEMMINEEYTEEEFEVTVKNYLPINFNENI